MPITYYYFCALATLLFYIPDKLFLETARFELVLLWDKLRYTWVKKSRKINKYSGSAYLPKYGVISERL
jgi:hypothetical protein